MSNTENDIPRIPRFVLTNAQFGWCQQGSSDKFYAAALILCLDWPDMSGINRPTNPESPRWLAINAYGKRSELMKGLENVIDLEERYRYNELTVFGHRLTSLGNTWKNNEIMAYHLMNLRKAANYHWSAPGHAFGNAAFSEAEAVYYRKLSEKYDEANSKDLFANVRNIVGRCTDEFQSSTGIIIRQAGRGDWLKFLRQKAGIEIGDMVEEGRIITELENESKPKPARRFKSRRAIEL